MSSPMAIVLVVAVLAVLALIPVILGEFIRAGHPSEDGYELISYGEEDDEEDDIDLTLNEIKSRAEPFLAEYATVAKTIIKPKRVIDWSQHEDLS